MSVCGRRPSQSVRKGADALRPCFSLRRMRFEHRSDDGDQPATRTSSARPPHPRRRAAKACAATLRAAELVLSVRRRARPSTRKRDLMLRGQLPNCGKKAQLNANVRVRSDLCVGNAGAFPLCPHSGALIAALLEQTERSRCGDQVGRQRRSKSSVQLSID